jgi:hypothetical protein
MLLGLKTVNRKPGEFHRWLQQSGIMSGVNAATNRWRCSVWLEGVSQGKNVM